MPSPSPLGNQCIGVVVIFRAHVLLWCNIITKMRCVTIQLFFCHEMARFAPWKASLASVLFALVWWLARILVIAGFAAIFAAWFWAKFPTGLFLEVLATLLA